MPTDATTDAEALATASLDALETVARARVAAGGGDAHGSAMLTLIAMLRASTAALAAAIREGDAVRAELARPRRPPPPPEALSWPGTEEARRLDAEALAVLCHALPADAGALRMAGGLERVVEECGSCPERTAAACASGLGSSPAACVTRQGARLAEPRSRSDV